VAGAYNMLSNQAIGDRMQEILDTLGPIEFDETEVAFARMIAESFPENLRLGILQAEQLPTDLHDKGLPTEVYPIRDRGEVLPGSTDVSDVSWITPTAQFTTTTFPLAVPGHSWGITAASGMSIGHKGMVHAAKVLAITAADLFEEPELLKQAQDEFAASTKGREYKTPLPDGTIPRQVIKA
jgi:aminobenzoyl-glutamate utilization protein B